MRTFQQYLENLNSEDDYRNSESYKKFLAMQQGGGQQTGQPVKQTGQPVQQNQPTPEERLNQFRQMAATPTTNPQLTGKPALGGQTQGQRRPTGVVPQQIAAGLKPSECPRPPLRKVRSTVIDLKQFRSRI